MKKVIKKEKDRKKGMAISLFIHGMLLAIALVPFLSNVEWAEAEMSHVVEIEFVYADVSSGAGSTAPKEVAVPQPEVEKEVVEKTVSPPVVESAPVLTEIETEEIVVEDIPESEAEEVILDEINEVVENDDEIEVIETVEPVIEEIEGNEEANDSEEGEGDEGVHISGKELGEMDFDGEGVFGRKVIHRADVKKITEKEGKVVINLCINREGMVTHVAFNRDQSTIMDSEYVRKAMDVASDYKFEKDYTAPDAQCGKLTFIFHI
jgi:hypothetical protein